MAKCTKKTNNNNVKVMTLEFSDECETFFLQCLWGDNFGLSSAVNQWGRLPTWMKLMYLVSFVPWTVQL